MKKNRCTNRIDIYVVRIRADGLLANAKPCAVCLDALRSAGIRRVFYSTDAQTLVREKVRNMENLHRSFFQLEKEKENTHRHWRF